MRSTQSGTATACDQQGITMSQWDSWSDAHCTTAVGFWRLHRSTQWPWWLQTDMQVSLSCNEDIFDLSNMIMSESGLTFPKNILQVLLDNSGGSSLSSLTEQLSKLYNWQLKPLKSFQTCFKLRNISNILLLWITVCVWPGFPQKGKITLFIVVEIAWIWIHVNV